MKLSELEEYVFAYFLSDDAANVSVDGRFLHREAFVQIFEDRMFYATQKFGGEVAGRHSRIANTLVDKLIDEGALSTSHDRLSGTSHQFDTGKYKKVIKDLVNLNEICRRSTEGGPEYWKEAFARMSNGNRPQ